MVVVTGSGEEDWGDPARVGVATGLAAAATAAAP